MSELYLLTNAAEPPSEIMPAAYRDWCATAGLDPDAMRPDPDELVAAG